MKTIKFYTFGCKVNQYETQFLRERCAEFGIKEIKGSRPADIYLVNTCTVTHRADADSLRCIAKARRQNPSALVLAAGCLAVLDSKRIKSADEKALLIKNKDKDSCWELLLKLLKLAQKKDLPQKARNQHRGISRFEGHTRAFLKIQDGCDHFCSYCKVPLVRGRSRSKQLSLIVKEARALVNNGYKEIVLSGICLGDYGKDFKEKTSLVDVIDALEQIEGLVWIRLSSIEINDVTDALVKKIAFSSKVCRHLHIPLQSGDNAILMKMNRHYTGAQFIQRVTSIKQQIIDLAITTDVLVGFPGEKEQHFQNTLKVIKAITPLKVHIFPFSPREGTQSFQCQDQIDPVTNRKRILMLRKVAASGAAGFLNQFLFKKMIVLIEGLEKNKLHLWQGHANNYLTIKVFSKKQLTNQLVYVKITGIKGDDLFAKFSSIIA